MAVGADVSSRAQNVHVHSRACNWSVAAVSSNVRRGCCCRGARVCVRTQLDRRLRDTMALIHDRVVNAAESVGHAGDLKVGANVASFNLLADAIRGQGLT